MKVFRWKLILTTAAAVGIPCFVLAENSTPAHPSPDNADAQVAADKQPGDGGPTTRPRHEGMRPHERPMVKGTFLGIGARPASPEIRAQFKLAEGTALLIDEVAPDSPAAKAGVQKFDVLTKVDDQLIVNPEQLAVLIRMHKANDQVKLGIIHEAAPATVAVTLVEKDLPPMDGGGPGRGGPEGMRGMHGMPGMMGGMHRFGMGPMGMHRPGGWMHGPMGGFGMHRGGPRGDDEMGGPEGPRGRFGPGDGEERGPGGPMGGRQGFGMRHGPRGGPDGPPDGDGPGGPGGPGGGPEGRDGRTSGGRSPDEVRKRLQERRRAELQDDGNQPATRPAPGGQQP